MDPLAIARLGAEHDTWLNRGRRALLAALLARHAPRGGTGALEIGAGFGHNLPLLKPWGPIDAVEVDSACWGQLEGRSELRRHYRTGLPDLALDERYAVVCALDVIEHIEDDRSALAWILDRLEPGGVLIATVPAYQWLFGPHDVANRHFRRYTRQRLIEAMPSGLKVETCGYFNTALLPAAVAAKAAFALKRHVATGSSGMDKQSSRLPRPLDALFYRVLAFEASLVGRGFRPPAGLSVYCVARRKA